MGQPRAGALLAWLAFAWLPSAAVGAFAADDVACGEALTSGEQQAPV